MRFALKTPEQTTDGVVIQLADRMTMLPAPPAEAQGLPGDEAGDYTSSGAETPPSVVS